MANIPIRGTHIYLRNGNPTQALAVTRMANQLYIVTRLNMSTEPVRRIGMLMTVSHPTLIRRMFNRLSSYFVQLPTVTPSRNTLPRHLRTRPRPRTRTPNR